MDDEVFQRSKNLVHPAAKLQVDGGDIYVIEVNASCYLEKNSEFAMAAKVHGIEYNDLVNQITEIAIERWKQRDPRQKKRRSRKAAT